jgi:hypothetical protein
VRVAVPDREAVREARQALGHAVDVAGDALLQARDSDFAAADGSGGWRGGGVGELYLWVVVRNLVCNCFDGDGMGWDGMVGVG